jgi:hypothetical protein
MDKDGEAAAEEEVVAEKNDEVVVEATEEGQWQANPRYKTTTNSNQANLAMADGNTLFDDKALEMPVVLRMNRNFMVFMREN